MGFAFPSPRSRSARPEDRTSRFRGAGYHPGVSRSARTVHHRDGVPFRATAPPRRTVRFRLPSPFALARIRCPPAFPPGGGRQTFARLHRRPVARSAAPAAPPKCRRRGPLALAPSEGVPLPRVPTLLHVLPNTRVGPARVSRSVGGASTASVPTRCAPVRRRSRATVRLRLPASTCRISRSAPPKRHGSSSAAGLPATRTRFNLRKSASTFEQQTRAQESGRQQVIRSAFFEFPNSL